MYTCSSDCNPSDPSCLERCNNCPINTHYVNCIMPRKEEAKTSNRHNLPLLPHPGLICHWINTNDDTRWQRTGWYHLSSRATKGALWCMRCGVLLSLVSVTVLQRVQLTGGGAAWKATESSTVRRESAASSRLGLRCEGLSETVLMSVKITASSLWRCLTENKRDF